MTRSADPAEWLKLFEKRGLDQVIAQEWARHARPHISLGRPTVYLDGCENDLGV